MKADAATLAKLPQDVLDSSGSTKKPNESATTPKTFLETRLRKNDIGKLKDELMKRFPLAKERQTFKKRIRRRGCPKNQTLSNSKKRALGLYTVEREGLMYKNLLPLHEMWLTYMDGYLDLENLKQSKQLGDLSNPRHEELALLLYKADYHGARVAVTKSTAPSLVGISGLLVFETKNILKLLGTDDITRTVPKATCEFEIVLGCLRLNFLGKNFLVKPPERSSKKLRGNKEFQL